MADAENDALIDQLDAQTKFMSSIRSMLDTDAAHDILEQDRSAIPMLLRALRARKAVIPAMALLAEITDHSPVQDEDRGRVPQMIAAWLEWGEGQGYE